LERKEALAMGPVIAVVVGLFCLFVIVLALSGITIVREYERCVVFRLGRLTPLRGPGLVIIIPLVERRRIVDLRTVTVDVPPQDAITKDSVTVKVDAVLYFRVVDPIKAVTAVVDFEQAIDLASLTTLRSVIGQHELSELLKNRDAINSTLKVIIDRMSEPWGIDVVSVDIKAVDIPEGMQRAMAKEAEATREKRARIIKAEAEAEASLKLTDAARQIAESPMALELRRMQMISEVGSEHNTTTIVLMPADFVTATKELTQFLAAKNQAKPS
jgi:regulator of protease activity HflC (stomatin/prohibitin superfamily)